MTKRPSLMKKTISSLALALGLLVGSHSVMAQEEGGLPSAGTNIRDQASLQRGAKLFFNYCAVTR
jgi:ubiquinol-cytochrome c reductase cytochrome c1 subunit